MRTMSISLIALAMSMIAVTHASACATKSNYDKISTGMSYSQVQGILGCGGEEVSSTDLMAVKTVMYMWKAGGVAGLVGGNMNAMFQNDALVSKAQFGLK